MGALLSADVKNITRDPMLLFILAAPVLMGTVLSVLIPFAEARLLEFFSIDLSGHYPLIAAVFSLIPAMLAGMLTGLVFLDERDEDILTALSVTPLSRGGYLLYRTLFTAGTGVVFFYLFLVILRLSPYPWALLLPSAVSAALSGAVLLLALALFAANKVEGLAMAKVSGVVFMAPVGAYFLPAPCRYLFALFPPFWPVESFLHALESATAGLLFWGIGGMLYHGIIIFFLGKLYLSAAALPLRKK